MTCIEINHEYNFHTCPFTLLFQKGEGRKEFTTSFPPPPTHTHTPVIWGTREQAGLFVLNTKTTINLMKLSPACFYNHKQENENKHINRKSSKEVDKTRS